MTAHQGRNTPLQLVLEMPDHETLTRLLQLVHEADLPAHTAHIARGGGSNGTVTVDLGVLTATQRRTLELALEAGYYERPREADLTFLADELDISKSAVSQRLRTAETKLVRHALGHHG